MNVDNTLFKPWTPLVRFFIWSRGKTPSRWASVISRCRPPDVAEGVEGIESSHARRCIPDGSFIGWSSRDIQNVRRSRHRCIRHRRCGSSSVPDGWHGVPGAAGVCTHRRCVPESGWRRGAHGLPRFGRGKRTHVVRVARVPQALLGWHNRDIKSWPLLTWK